MTRVSAPSLFELGNDAPSRLRLSPHKSLMSSVIGNTFKKPARPTLSVLAALVSLIVVLVTVDKVTLIAD